jgi:hypothetical protein
VTNGLKYDDIAGLLAEMEAGRPGPDAAIREGIGDAALGHLMAILERSPIVQEYTGDETCWVCSGYDAATGQHMPDCPYVAARKFVEALKALAGG